MTLPPSCIFDENRDVFAAFDAEPRFVTESVGGASILNIATFSAFAGSMLGLFHGARLCRDADLPIELYVSLLVTDLVDNIERYAPLLDARRYDDDIEATIDVFDDGVEKIVSTSEMLGVDAAYPRLVKRYLEQAIAAGYGGQEFPAMSEVLGSNDT